jgi:hypothetical protein
MYIRVPREQKVITFFSPVPTGKYHSAFSPYALNELNLAELRKYCNNTKKNIDVFFLSWIGCNERKNPLTLLFLYDAHAKIRNTNLTSLPVKNILNHILY